MPDQINHFGFECPVTVDGVDYHMTDPWKGSVTGTEQEITNTSHYNATTNECWSDSIGSKLKFEGSFKANYDSNLKPWPNLKANKVINALVLKCDNTGSTISMKALCKTLKVEPESLEGLVSFEVTFTNKGAVTYS